jgi:hypothetical protein
MSRLRSKDNDGTSYFFEEDGKLTVKKTENVNPLLKRNKELTIIMMVILLQEK